MNAGQPAAQAVVSFGLVRRAFHWLTVLLLAASFLLVWSIDGLTEGLLRPQVLNLHRSVGLLVLGLSVMRLLWNLLSARPGPLAAAPWQRAARGVQAVLLVCLLLVPLLGWAYSNARGHGLSLWGMPLPSLIFKDQYFSRVFRESHEFLAYTLLALIAAHAAAALWHHLVLRDATLRRMWRG
jgi:cytochrome b561